MMDELTPICQMKDLLLGGSTTCMREKLEPDLVISSSTLIRLNKDAFEGHFAKPLIIW